MSHAMSSDYARYDPTGGARMRRDLGDAFKRRLTVVRKSSRVGAVSAGLSGLGDFSWTGALEKLGTQLVTGRISELAAERQAAEARLATAEAEARTIARATAAEVAARRDADAAAARSIAAAQATGQGKIFGLPIPVVAIGALAIGGGAYYLLRKKGK